MTKTFILQEFKRWPSKRQTKDHRPSVPRRLKCQYVVDVYNIC